MITSSQMRAARVMLGIEQSRLGEMAGLPVHAIQSTESSNYQVIGTTDALTSGVEAVERPACSRSIITWPEIGIGRGMRLHDLDWQNGRAIRAAMRPKKFTDHAG